jgi:4-amino-4-deoxy-L-arabinose transferase-like glycosyltransferase
MTSAELASKQSHAGSVGKDAAPSVDRPVAGNFDAWVARNSAWIALCIIVVGFAFRLYYCGACYLNPDEAQHFNAARPSTWSGAYHESMRLAHPPLFVLVLHAFLILGRSEMILRLPSLLAATAALWIAFIWLRRSLGEIPALVGLLFMAVSPAAISASTEVRQYGLQLLFICSVLYATERALTEQSTRWAVIQGLCLLGALLTHYSTPVVIASIGIYNLLRCIIDRAPRRLWFIFAAAQVVLALVLLWLYVTNLSKSSLSHVAGFSYANVYFPRGGETALAFSKRALVATFAYLVNQKRAYLAMLLLAAGIAALFVGRTKAPRLMGLLIIFPFIIGFMTGIVHALPFAGSRHQTYLLPFLAAGFAAAITWIPRRFAALSLLPVLALALFFIARNSPDNNPRLMPMRDMTATINYINETIPLSAPLFVDEQTRFILGYYLGRNDSGLDAPRAIWNNPTVGDRRLVSSRDWLFDPNDAIAHANKLADGIGLPAGDPLWIVSTAWLDVPLDQRLHTGTAFLATDFGKNAIIKSTHE